MTAELGLGTYRCRSIPDAVTHAQAVGVRFVDTAPNYAHGTAQTQLAPFLAANPEVQVCTKVGFAEGVHRVDAIAAGALNAARTGHSITAEYVRWQVERNRAELGRDRIDLVLLHNPELAPGPHAAILDAFTALEAEAVAGRIAGYGVATWSGFTDDVFTIPDLTALAEEAATGRKHHFAAVQLPISLVRIEPLAEALEGRGPVVDASAVGIAVLASAPLHGGELPTLATPELADYIRPGLTPAAAALHVVLSCPGVTHVLLSASTAPHWRDAAHARDLPPLPRERLQEITRVLAAT